MTRIILFFVISLFLGSTGVYAGEDYEISTSLNLDEVGINKVLCMRNGFTMLFHLEIGKPIRVMVFDTGHKRLVSREQQCRELDLFALPTTTFKGLFEVNGEAVIFFEQANTGRHSLLMLRFSGINGKLIEERRVGRSRSMARPSRFYVMHQPAKDGYQILYAQDAMQYKESRIHVAYYNKNHEMYQDIPLEFDRGQYDYMTVVGAESQPEGVCVTLGLSNMLVNGSHANNVSVANPIYNHYLQIFYIPADSTKPFMHNVDLSENAIPYNTHLSHNPFANTFNLLLLSYSDALYRYGIEMRPTSLLSDIFFSFNPLTMDSRYKWVTHKKANEYLIKKTDTTAWFAGIPLSFFTNRQGLSTIVSESYERNIASETHNRAYVQETFLGNLCVTQLDDEGNEMWGTVLPRSQYYKSYRHYYSPSYIGKRWQQHALFNDMPPQVYERQFLSANVYNNNTGNIYIVYNDGSNVIPDSFVVNTDTMYVSALSNAVYYTIDRAHNITRKYLFGEPMKREYKSSFIEGGDFDEQRSTYASVIRYKRSGYVSLRMAWAKLQ